MEWSFFKLPDRPRFPSVDDRFLEELVRTKGEDDSVVYRHVWIILRGMRFRHAVSPWISLLQSAVATVKIPLKYVWSKTYGLYRKSSPPVHIGAALQSGGLSGAVPGAGPFPSGAAATFNPIGTFNVSSVSTPIGPGSSFEDAGIRAGEIVAYRCWMLRDGFLYSTAQSTFKWEPGVVAEGDPTNQYSGIHAFKNRLDACAYIGQQENKTHAVVSGTVELWGEVFEHTLGYRASRARIKSIDDSPHYDAVALRKQYQLNRKSKK